MERLGVGVGEVRLSGLGLLPAQLSAVSRDIGCGFGPSVRVGSEVYGSTVSASPRELADGAEVPARLCGPEVPLESGDTRVVLGPAPAFRPVGAVLRRSDATAPGWAPPGTTVGVEVLRTDAARGTLVLPQQSQEGSVLTLAENANIGWEATTPDGAVLDPVVVDGWQQGWRLPPGVERVSFRFTPDLAYRSALGAGGSALVLLALATFVLPVLPRWRRRQRPDPAAPGVGARELPWPALAGLGVLAAGLVAGWPGVLVAAATSAVAALIRGRVPQTWAAALATAPLLGAALTSWVRPWGSAEGWAGTLTAPQLLALVTVSAVVALEPDRWVPRSFHRRAGRSTQR